MSLDLQNEEVRTPSNTNTQHQQTPKSILNLSSHNLSEHQAEILIKGLSYIPKPSTHDLKDAQQGIDRLARALKIRYSYIRFKNRAGANPLSIPSNFTPHKGSYPTGLDLWEIRMKQECRKAPKQNNAVDNFGPQEWKALKQLKSNKKIIIKSADKGSAIVVQDRHLYIFEAEKQLASTLHYKKIDKPIFPETAVKINEVLTAMKKDKLITAKEFKFLKADPLARERVFYLLPKIHKDPTKWTVPGKVPPGRPIVSDCGSESYNVAKFIDIQLAPYSTVHPTYVKNTYDFLEKVKAQHVPSSALLISLDVDALYTNISHDFGLLAVRRAFERDPRPIHKYILELLGMSLATNDFEFNNTHYLQVFGTAMGKKYAPRFADITMAFWEELNAPKINLQPLIHFRYLDDIILITDTTKDQFLEAFQVLNATHPNIKLKYELEDQQLAFLDVLLYKGEGFQQTGILDTKVYCKPTDSHALLHNASYHPRHTFSGIIKSQFIRYRRICNEDKDYWEAVEILIKALENRGYKRRELASMAKQMSDYVHPSTHKARMSKCGARNCSICPLLVTTPTTTIDTKPIRIRSDSNCNTKESIYVAFCPKCPNSHYVGQTLSFRERTLNHLSDIRLGKDKPVANHFKDGPEHEFRIFIVETPPRQSPTKIPETLNKLERKWIAALEANTKGLNLTSGNFSLDPSIFVLKHSDMSGDLNTTANSLLKDCLEEGRSHRDHDVELIHIMQANRANDNLSDSLVRSRLPDLDE